MRYFIAHILSGEAERYHRALSDELATRFDLEPISRRIPPHLTLKAPFDTEDLADIEKVLGDLAREEAPLPFTLEGVGVFHDTVIFMDVGVPHETHMLLERFQERLKEISWLTFSKTEMPLTLHATLAYANDLEQGREMYAYLMKKQHPIFHCMLDTVSLLRKPEKQWEVPRTVYLSQTKNDVTKMNSLRKS